MFKVVPDQLRVSDGWVRCGQCDEVFDANVHMQSGIQIAESPAPNRKNAWGVSSPVEPPEAALLGHREHVPDDATGEQSHQSIAPEVCDPEADHMPVEIDANATDDLVVVDDLKWRTPVAELADSQADVSEELQDNELPKLSFMRASPAPSVWNRPLVRAGLAMCSVFLCGVLLLQVLIQERDRIAATAPGTKALLMSVCTVWGCEISPLRQIDSVVIDSSSFVKVRADVYRLNFTLKNTAKIHVATPALELSLTDMKDLPAVRRVIAALEFAPQQELIEPDAEFSASLPVSVKLSGGTDRISGYRLLAFYP